MHVYNVLLLAKNYALTCLEIGPCTHIQSIFSNQVGCLHEYSYVKCTIYSVEMLGLFESLCGYFSCIWQFLMQLKQPTIYARAKTFLV